MCFIYLALIKGGNNGRYWDDRNVDPKNYYKQLSDYAIKELDYKGGAMNESMIIEVGKHFNLISGEYKFSQDANKEEYFLRNQSKIKMINIPGHTGQFSSYNSKTGKVFYYDYKREQDCSINDIISVFYK